MDLDFTGEQCIPGKTSTRIVDDHISRYQFALQFAQGKSVLDCACGSGYGSKMLKDGGAAHVDGVDVSQELIDYATDHFEIPGVDFLVDDLAHHHLMKKYDVITSFETIEHVDDYKTALRNMFNLLHDGGVLLISTPNRLITSPHMRSLLDRPHNPYHVREFTVNELRADLRNVGFSVSDGDVYGHRQQRYFRNRYVRRLYKILVQPDVKKSPIISRLYAQPRSFLIVAHRVYATL